MDILTDKAQMKLFALNSNHDIAEKIAKAAGVQTLILGHYSSRYKDKRVFQEEAQTIFPNTLLSEDGKEFLFSE